MSVTGMSRYPPDETIETETEAWCSPVPLGRLPPAEAADYRTVALSRENQCSCRHPAAARVRVRRAPSKSIYFTKQFKGVMGPIVNPHACHW